MRLPWDSLRNFRHLIINLLQNYVDNKQTNKHDWSALLNKRTARCITESKLDSQGHFLFQILLKLSMQLKKPHTSNEKGAAYSQ